MFDRHTLHDHSKICSILDILEVPRKSGQADAPTSVTPGLTTEKEWLMSSVPVKTSRQQIAVDYLSLSREHVERSKSLRLHYMRLAKAEGLTNQQVGEIVGLTEARVRQLLRAE